MVKFEKYNVVLVDFVIAKVVKFSLPAPAYGVVMFHSTFTPVFMTNFLYFFLIFSNVKS